MSAIFALLMPLPRRLLTITCWLLLVSAHTLADEPAHTPENTFIEELVVWGSLQSQLGVASSAAEGLVGYTDFSSRILARVGELVEVVPGMVASQHSGEGKANQYFLRGVSLDHGTDFSADFEGMPVNLRSHAHGHGYLDLNFIIPEIVSTVRYQKGPYAADRGDFSTVGTTSFSLYDSINRPFVQLGVGEDGYLRTVAAGSTHLAHGHLLAAVELARDDGPWSLAQGLRKNNVLVKYSGHWGETRTRAFVSHYDNKWRATDQIPKRLVDAGALSRFGFVDPTVGGDTSRTSIGLGLQGTNWEASLYLSRYQLDLFSNFTYFLEDPVNSDQIQQADKRLVYGGQGSRSFDLNEAATLTLGADLRVDDISQVDLNRTNRRRFISSVRNDKLTWYSLGTYAALDIQWSPAFRSTMGVRLDYFDFDVTADNQADGRERESNVVSSLSVAYTLTPNLEAYANWGQGFHSNDVRGVFDPSLGVDVFADQEGAEFGLRYAAGNIQSTLTWFWLRSDSELLFVGDAGSTEPSGGSKRQGVEFSWFWALGDHWSFDINGAVVDSKFTGVPNTQDEIPNTFGRVAGAGLTYSGAGGLSAGLRVRHFGNAPIVEDGSVEQNSSTIVNGNLSYRWRQWQVGLDLLNVFDREDDDIAYYFDSRLASENSAVADVHFHPVLPRTLRLSLRYSLGGDTHRFNDPPQ